MWVGTMNGLEFLPVEKEKKHLLIWCVTALFVRILPKKKELMHANECAEAQSVIEENLQGKKWRSVRAK